MTRFHDAHIRPPRGGWSFPIAGNLVTRYSEAEILEEIARWQRNNNQFVSEAAIREELWRYYCAREPARCGGTPQEIQAAAMAAAVVPAEKTPELQGPAIWRFLNTLAAVWTPQIHDYFLSTLDHLSSIIECPKCKHEWRETLAQEQPIIAKLGTRLGVCQWLNRVHNTINARLGKPEYPYLRMVTEYGAPLP